MRNAFQSTSYKITCQKIMESCPIKNKTMNENAEKEPTRVIITKVLGRNLEVESGLVFHNLGIPSTRKNIHVNNTDASVKYTTRLRLYPRFS